MDEITLTRKQLQEQLDAANARIAQLQSAPDPKIEAQLEAAKAELARLQKPQPAPTGRATASPYKGTVQATEDCHVGGFYREGPKDGKPGEVFEVDLPALWSDDPFVAVKISGYHESGQPITEPLGIARADFRFRQQDKGAADLIPLRANQF
jgi:hypothetical protein